MAQSPYLGPRCAAKNYRIRSESDKMKASTEVSGRIEVLTSRPGKLTSSDKHVDDQPCGLSLTTKMCPSTKLGTSAVLPDGSQEMWCSGLWAHWSGTLSLS